MTRGYSEWQRSWRSWLRRERDGKLYFLLYEHITDCTRYACYNKTVYRMGINNICWRSRVVHLIDCEALDHGMITGPGTPKSDTALPSGIIMR